MRTILAALALTAATIAYAPFSGAVTLPDPQGDAPLAASHGTMKTVLAGGCFWGMQEVFEHVKGVTHVTAGYAGGTAQTADYETVSSGTTGHAESVEITWDPAQVTFGQLLKVYFSVAHDPTELNRQGPDEGTQYRSAIFFAAPEQQKIASDYVAQLDDAKVFEQPIVTQIVPFKGFYKAEGYHQDYARHHPMQPYIAIYDLPKVDALKRDLPDLYAEAVTN
jgi:peptide-methionine (S)-S-oxide reductase